MHSTTPFVYLESDLLQCLPDGSRICPIRLVEDCSGAADYPRHVRQRAICPVNFAVQRIDKHGPLDAALDDESAGRSELVLKAGVVEPTIAWVGFPRVDECRANSGGLKF